MDEGHVFRLVPNAGRKRGRALFSESEEIRVGSTLFSTDPYAAVAHAGCCAYCYKYNTPTSPPSSSSSNTPTGRSDNNHGGHGGSDGNSSSSSSSAALRCSGCTTVYYCSRQCQRDDWSNHRPTCFALRKLIAENGGKPTPSVVLLALAIMRRFRIENVHDHLPYVLSHPMSEQLVTLSGSGRGSSNTTTTNNNNHNYNKSSGPPCWATGAAILSLEGHEEEHDKEILQTEYARYARYLIRLCGYSSGNTSSSSSSLASITPNRSSTASEESSSSSSNKLNNNNSNAMKNNKSGRLDTFSNESKTNDPLGKTRPKTDGAAASGSSSSSSSSSTNSSNNTNNGSRSMNNFGTSASLKQGKIDFGPPPKEPTTLRFLSKSALEEVMGQDGSVLSSAGASVLVSSNTNTTSSSSAAAAAVVAAASSSKPDFSSMFHNNNAFKGNGGFVAPSSSVVGTSLPDSATANPSSSSSSSDQSNESLGIPPSFEEAISLFCILRCNVFTICDAELRPTGIGMYPLSASLLNHSCSPNCIALYVGKQQIVRALRRIAPGEELTVSYVDIGMPTPIRVEELRKGYFFDCDCHRCTAYVKDENELAPVRALSEEERITLVEAQLGEEAKYKMNSLLFDLDSLVTSVKQRAITIDNCLKNPDDDEKGKNEKKGKQLRRRRRVLAKKQTENESTTTATPSNKSKSFGGGGSTKLTVTTTSLGKSNSSSNVAAAVGAGGMSTNSSSSTRNSKLSPKSGATSESFLLDQNTKNDDITTSNDDEDDEYEYYYEDVDEAISENLPLAQFRPAPPDPLVQAYAATRLPMSPFSQEDVKSMGARCVRVHCKGTHMMLPASVRTKFGVGSDRFVQPVPAALAGECSECGLALSKEDREAAVAVEMRAGKLVEFSKLNAPSTVILGAGPILLQQAKARLSPYHFQTAALANVVVNAALSIGDYELAATYCGYSHPGYAHGYSVPTEGGHPLPALQHALHGKILHHLMNGNAKGKQIVGHFREALRVLSHSHGSGGGGKKGSSSSSSSSSPGFALLQEIQLLLSQAEADWSSQKASGIKDEEEEGDGNGVDESRNRYILAEGASSQHNKKKHTEDNNNNGGGGEGKGDDDRYTRRGGKQYLGSDGKDELEMVRQSLEAGGGKGGGRPAEEVAAGVIAEMGT